MCGAANAVVIAAVHYQGTPEGVEDNGSLTRVAAFPIGIDPERFAAALEDDAVRGSIAQLLNKYAGRKVSQYSGQTPAVENRSQVQHICHIRQPGQRHAAQHHGRSSRVCMGM